jgi:hypothetical protein
MFALLLVMQLAVQQPATTSVIGSLVPPDNVKLSKPARVVLLPENYASLWSSEAQKRIDSYWEEYKPMFAQKKELFLRISSQAQREALDVVLERMRRDNRINLSELVHQSTATGQFEFKNLKAGNYRILATLAVAETDYIWSEPVGIEGGVNFIQLKNHTP